MKPGGIAGAIAGGIVGALVWGAIAKFMQVEVGYVAWGVGIAVGFLSFALGGRGGANGLLCAIVALLAIFGGKVLAVKWSATAEGAMEEIKNYGPSKVLPEDQQKMLAEKFAAEFSWSDAIEATKENLDFMDILFAVLGIGSAFKLGAAQEESAPTGPGRESPLRDVAAPEPPAPPAMSDVAPAPESEPREDQPNQPPASD